MSDPALAQALPRKQTDRDLGLIQPTVVLGGVVHGEPIPPPASGLFAEAFHHRLARMRTQIVQHPMEGVRLRVADRDLQQVVRKLRRGAVGRHLGGWPYRNVRIRRRAAPLVPASWPGEDELLGGAPPVSRPHKPPVPAHSAAFRTRPRCPPCAGCTPDPVPPRTTFFSRHGFRSWFSSKTRIVSRPTRRTSLRFTTSSVSRRTVQRARPSGGGPHASATMRCRCCLSSKAAFPGRGRSYNARSKPPCR